MLHDVDRFGLDMGHCMRPLHRWSLGRHIRSFRLRPEQHVLWALSIMVGETCARANRGQVRAVVRVSVRAEDMCLPLLGNRMSMSAADEWEACFGA